MRERLDLLLVARGLAESRERAQALILAGQVRVNGQRADKAGHRFDVAAAVEIQSRPPFVSRGGVKLSGALESLAIDVRDRICLDVGASTGGFTDCLLQRGARHVYALDVGCGLLHARLRADSRVTPVERCNARHLVPTDLPEPVTLATVDVSFISLSLVLPPVAGVVAPGGEILALCKPQFEAGRGATRRGVVRDPAVRRAAVDKVRGICAELGLTIMGEAESVLAGPKGNLEVFVRARK